MREKMNKVKKQVCDPLKPTQNVPCITLGLLAYYKYPSLFVTDRVNSDSRMSANSQITTAYWGHLS
jgi:hypothetical protein